MAKPIINVTPNPAKATNRVILWERHPDHPGGEVYIAGNTAGPVAVAATPEIKSLIFRGHLIDQGQAAAQAPAAEAQPDGQPEAAAQPDDAQAPAAEKVTAAKRGRPATK